MRKLIIMRGLPGSGKSTWIKKNNLDPYTLCPDDIRLMFRSPVMDNNGRYHIDAANDKRVWEFVYERIEERMDRGELIVVDGIHIKGKSFNRYLKLAKQYFYEIACVDFTDTPLDVCLSQNAQRKEYKRVPEDVIKNMHSTLGTFSIPRGVQILSREGNSTHCWIMDSFKHINVSAYKKIHHIGDIQGCMDPLKEYFADGFKDDELYIFTGDLLDRGIQNGEVLEWAISNMMRDNVIFIMGNHERHLLKYVSDLPFKSQEFQLNTLPQIAHVDKRGIAELVSKMQDCFVYIFHGKHIFVSHGGIGTVPDIDFLPYLASKTFWNGTGVYGDPIDVIFNDNTKGYLQIHGHRNRNSVPLQVTPTSFNLEGKIEFGGNLRTVQLEFDDKRNDVILTTREIANFTHKTKEECLSDY